MIRSCLALFAVAVVVSAEQPQLDLSTKALVARATRYVSDYEAQFRFLIAEEAYVQHVFDAAGARTGERRMKGELFLAFIAADAISIAVRDVAEVDGEPVADREDLRALLQKGDLIRIARRIADRNATFNIGGIQRNFNEPTLPLLLLGPKDVGGVSFDRREVMRTADATRATLAFAERDKPTLIRDLRGMPIFSKGEFLLDAATGRVERTTLELKSSGIVAHLTTTYAPDEKLNMWVPTVFTERYEGKVNGRRELILCEARYSNYRRFEVTGRIK